MCIFFFSLKEICPAAESSMQRSARPSEKGSHLAGVGEVSAALRSQSELFVVLRSCDIPGGVGKRQSK